VIRPCAMRAMRDPSCGRMHSGRGVARGLSLHRTALCGAAILRKCARHFKVFSMRTADMFGFAARGARGFVPAMGPTFALHVKACVQRAARGTRRSATRTCLAGSQQVQVVAGRLRGRRIHAPDTDATRPSSERVRTSLFDRLQPRIRDARVLDLYAGSGALGIEALSRGAAHATFVERSPRALAALRRNLTDLELGAWARVLSGDVEQALERLAGEPGFEIVLMDPPYGASSRAERGAAGGTDRSMGTRDPAGGAAASRPRKARGAAAADGLSARAQRRLARLVVPGGCVVVERSRRDVVWDMEGFCLRDSREHGETRLDWYERAQEEVA
jgi:16S rRNA (guanine(966)-N(2))-methyltransferase RsmD